MLSEKEIMLMRNHIADFCVVLVDAACSGSKEDTLSVMEDFSKFICNALMAAKRDGRRNALITTTN
jgi:hypothetical protein